MEIGTTVNSNPFVIKKGFPQKEEEQAKTEIPFLRSDQIDLSTQRGFSWKSFSSLLHKKWEERPVYPLEEIPSNPYFFQEAQAWSRLKWSLKESAKYILPLEELPLFDTLEESRDTFQIWRNEKWMQKHILLGATGLGAMWGLSYVSFFPKIGVPIYSGDRFFWGTGLSLKQESQEIEFVVSGPFRFQSRFRKQKDKKEASVSLTTQW